jgi:pSer/pThr/pTyr-binding forkhead associated (FHA) protein
MSEPPEGPYLVDAAGRRFSLARPVTLLGRSPQADVFVPDRRASRRHAEIAWDGLVCTLTDLGSDNGTLLNGRRVAGPEALADGDQVAVASAVLLFRDPEATLRETDWPLLVVDRAGGDIWVDRRPVSLSPKERCLFDWLYAAGGRVCTRDEIARAVWPEYRAEVSGYQIESLVKRVREKIEPDPRRPVLIVTVPGRGYRLVKG